MAEYLDIVDENGKPTGESKTRPEMHSGDHRHNTVHLYVFRKTPNDLEFLVHLRSKLKDHSPNKWDTRFGGHVKSGETVEQTAVGELFEEAGLTVEFKNLIKGLVLDHDWPNNHELTWAYYYPYAGAISSLKFNDGEVQEAKWMAAKDILHSLKDEATWSGGLEGFEDVLSDLKRKL